jgi:ribonuclease HI
LGGKVSFDLRALKLYVDGSCRGNPGGAGGFAVRIEFPFDWGRPDMLLESRGFIGTNNNRMELEPCIFAHEWMLEGGMSLGVAHFQIVTDSEYVYGNYNRAVGWSKNGWRNFIGRPLDNIDQWKILLRLRRKIGCRVRVEMKLIEGKSTPIAKAVDRDAKAASLVPFRVDRGFRGGKVGWSRNSVGGSSRMFPAAGGELVIRVYGTAVVRRDEQKVKFQTFCEERRHFFEKYRAYAGSAVGNALHRQHVYRVRMNDVPQYPRIEEILEELQESKLVRSGASVGH